MGFSRHAQHQNGLRSLNQILEFKVKKTNWLVTVLLGACLTLGATACKKSGPSGNPQSLEDGMAQLRESLANANGNVQSNLYSGVAYGIRYGNYTQALGSMDAIVNDPSLDAKQKALANQVIELLKTKAQAEGGAAQPAAQ